MRRNYESLVAEYSQGSKKSISESLNIDKFKDVSYWQNYFYEVESVCDIIYDEHESFGENFLVRIQREAKIILETAGFGEDDINEELKEIGVAIYEALVEEVNDLKDIITDSSPYGFQSVVTKYFGTEEFK